MNKIYRFFLKIFMCTIIFLVLGIFSKKNYRYREKIHYYLYEDNINFYKIIEFSPYEDDIISKKLIKLYQQYIFRIDINNSEDVESVINLDKVVSKYIDDYLFRREMQKQILQIRVKKDTKDILKEIIYSIIKIFDNYEEYTTRVIYISKWI